MRNKLGWIVMMFDGMNEMEMEKDFFMMGIWVIDDGV